MEELLNGFPLQLLWGAVILYEDTVRSLRSVCAFYLFSEGLLVSIRGQFLLEECTWIPLKPRERDFSIPVFMVERQRRDVKSCPAHLSQSHSPKLSQKRENTRIQVLMFVSHTTASKKGEKVLC